MRIGVLGGDGFCGWPTALRLSRRGHEVAIVDNLVRRQIDEELKCDSLTPISSIEHRLASWERVGGKRIRYDGFDLKNYDELVKWLREFRPEVIVHFAEQRSAPYSMLSSWHRRYTVNNNVNVTHNLLSALVELDMDVHVVHLGTMGVYGYHSDFEITEGYVDVMVPDAATKEPKVRRILHPADPGSIYHMTKVLDEQLLYFYRKNWGLRITDLHQGVVWGTQTEETLQDESLINRFDYDGEYGTVLNRFIVQSVKGVPMSVYGTGEQTRGFIHLEDSVSCVVWAVENPPSETNEVRIFNQLTETFQIKALSALVKMAIPGGEISLVENPRKEAAKNELKALSTLVKKLERPVHLTVEQIQTEGRVASRYIGRIMKDAMESKAKWLAKR